MKKPTIAVDIDDVLAANAEAFIDFTNKRWGTNLTVDDYTEHWIEIWQVDHEEEIRRINEVHSAMIFKDYRHFPEAKPVLKALSKNYNLVVLTSRQKVISKDTLDWVERYYKGIFSDVHFAGIWDGMNKDSHVRIKHTKGRVVREIGADYLIDDQVKHCLAAAEAGIEALLFGNYTWNQLKSLPKGVTRVNDWQAVLEYFDAKSR